MSDAIKAAMREAEHACSDWLDGAVAPAMWTKQASAAAVAAFLRALPPCDVLMDRPEGAMHSTRTLAAAVERAAKEGA